MKPIELYEMAPERVDLDVTVLFGCYFCHVPEIQHLDLDTARNKRVEIRYLKDFAFDGRRIWRLATVWLDGGPVMVIQNAGREGDDFSRRIVTDEGLYVQMVKYLASLVSVTEKLEKTEMAGMGDEVVGLTWFHGHGLTDPFESF